MDPFNGKFGAQDVAAATNTTPKQITDWCNQGHIVGQKEPLGKGRRREFTFSNVMEVACGVALMQHGIQSPADAFRAAMRFAHIGSAHGGWVNEAGETVETNPRPKRHPGLPYHYLDGETFLVVSGERSAVIRVVKWQFNTHDIFRDMLSPPAAFIALNVTQVFKEVVKNLGEHFHTEKDYRIVLDQEYGR